MKLAIRIFVFLISFVLLFFIAFKANDIRMMRQFFLYSKDLQDGGKWYLETYCRKDDCSMAYHRLVDKNNLVLWRSSLVRFYYRDPVVLSSHSLLPPDPPMRRCDPDQDYVEISDEMTIHENLCLPPGYLQLQLAKIPW